MTQPELESDSRILSPPERFSEILFGLIMVLSFTCAMSVATAGKEDVREMLVGAIGCNLAWGIVDAVMYLLNVLAGRGRSIALLRSLRGTSDAALAHRIVAEALPPLVASTLKESDLESIREQLRRLPEPPARPWLEPRDWRGAAGVFLLVFLSTFPVVVPFVFIGAPALALRVSNGIAIAMLFVAGYKLALYSGLRPARTGLAMVTVGAVLVAVTIALGG
ncbi:MAG: VIT1/CCC1 transporter family protein [Verrucomicrobiae bacterium]|nr:VIT1/CCC1 transporter family protein [Verrucomicrobiae bacterium]